MGKNKPKTRPDYVEHPRFGSAPIASGYTYSIEEIKAAFWSYRAEEKRIFPETAIPANSAKQNYSIYPRSLYVDLHRVCRACQRPFIFFAQEQKYWFEELQFFVDADCVHCPECRKARHELNAAIKTYSEHARQEWSTPDQIIEFAEVTLDVMRLGGLKRPTKLYEALKKLASMGDYDSKILEIKDAIKNIAGDIPLCPSAQLER